MATVCAAPQTVGISSSFHTGLSSSARLKSGATLAIPHRQNGSLKVRASAQESCSRREAMATVAAGAGLAGLLLLLPVGSAEAIGGLPRVKPESRKDIKEELEKIKNTAVKFTEESKKNVQNVVKAASDKLPKKGKFDKQ